MFRTKIAIDRSKLRWVILIITYLSQLSYAVVLQSVPPVLSLIIPELNLSHTEAGLLMSLFSIAGLFLSIPAGLLADRYGQKRIFVLSFIMMILGPAIFATSHSFTGLLLGRMIAGAGAMTIVVVGPHLLSEWFAGRELGLAIGINSSAFPFGSILSLTAMSYIGENLGWRTSIAISIAFPAVALACLILLFVPTPRKKGGKTSFEAVIQNIKTAGTPIWIAGIAWMLFNAAVFSFFTFTPDFLKSVGFGVAEAGVITSANMWPPLIMNPLVGFITDRKNHKPQLIVAGGVATAVTFLMVPGGTSWILGLMILIGVVQSVVPTPMFSLPPEIMSPAKLGLGFGILATFFNLGIIVGPATAGFLRDHTGSYQASYILMAVFSLLVAAVMVVFILRKAELVRTIK